MNCGKSFAVKHLINTMGLQLAERKCKDKLHELTMSFFAVHEDRYWEIYENRALKEKALPEFSVNINSYNALMESLNPGDGDKKIHTWADNSVEMVNISIREAMIYVSECICKPTFGKGYFGEARIKSMSDNETAIDDSTGFQEELYPAIEQLGQENIILIRIHGRGEFASNDSRNYIPDGVIENTIDIDNSVDSEQALQSFLETVGEEVDSFLAQTKEHSNVSKLRA